MKKGITKPFVNASIANFLPTFCALKGGGSGMLVCVIPLAVSYRSFSSLQGDGSDGEELPKPKNKSNARLSVVQWIAAFDRRYCLPGMLYDCLLCILFVPGTLLPRLLAGIGRMPVQWHIKM